MAELYAKPFETIDTGYNPQQPQGGGQSSEADEYLSSLPPEERQAAIQRLNAPLTGEELATLAQSGQKQPSLAEFAEIEKFHKNHEISFIDGLGKIAEGGEQFMTDISKAFGAMIDNPSDVASKMPATAVEAFAQGTRNFYGMLAQSNNTDSTLFKVKDFLNGTGTIEDRYNQYIQALKFNKDSMELMEGKQTMVMDADMINHEVTQAMAYIADPSLFIPFGKVASTGLRAVGLGEKLAMAGARSAAIKNGIIGNTIKWGVGQPLEFLGGAVRNTIDFGLEKAGAALETTTGIGAKEFAQTARMSGIGFSASAVAGYSVPFASTVSDAYIVGSSARGFGEAITLVGETMKKNKFGRGINSWAAEALEQAEKSGTVLSPHAKGLLKTLNAVDPLFAYGWNGLETAAEGGLIGGGLGYLSGGQEGMYSGIGAGIAMGAVGGTAGKMVADVTGGTNVARRAVQAKMVIEGHKVTNPDKAMFFQAMQTAAEARGKDVDLVNGIIAGIDKVAPNFEFHALTPDQFYAEAKRKGYDPTTGKFKEISALDSEFGGDRASKSRAMSLLRSLGGEFAGNRKAFEDAIKNNKKFTPDEIKQLTDDAFLHGRARLILSRFGFINPKGKKTDWGTIMLEKKYIDSTLKGLTPEQIEAVKKHYESVTGYDAQQKFIKDYDVKTQELKDISDGNGRKPSKYNSVSDSFNKLTKTQQEAVLKEIDGQGELAKELGGATKLRDHYDTLTWAEGWTDQLVKKFETDREGSRKDITEMLAQETGKDGKLNRKGRALADKLRAEGFLDRDNKLLRERNLLQADLTISQFAFSKGAVIGRESDGKTHMYINLNSMGNETFPHELFHTIMRESPMKKYFTDSLISKLLGTVDKDGKLVRPAEVNIGQVQKFFKKYIDLTHRNDDGTLDVQASEAKFKLVQEALTEYQNAGSNKKISDKARGLLEHYSEEFGAYYFSHWLMGRNRNTLFFGGELKGIEGLVERTKDSFKDFWQSKVSKSNPEFDFSNGLNEAFDRSKGLGRIASVDYYMRDMVRAASNANREAFRPDAMTLDNLKDFERSNGLRNLTTVDGNRRLNPREQVTQNIRLGKEAFKILSGVDRAMRTSKDVIDENGKQVITGRLSETELDALVKGGIVPRAWADKVNQGYAMLDGTISNVFSAGYLGKTEQTTDASYPRLTGRDVAFKNRKAVLFDVETKVKADGTFYTLFHTLDLAVIEQEANRLFQNTDYRALFDGDRAVMEADFFRYLSNASKASTDQSKLDSAALLDKGDGLGAKRRDVLHQMGRMALQTGDAYKHQPIAVIPEGFRHSVTTFNIDGMTTPRVETGTRVDIDMKNAHKFIRENWQPDEMKQEKTATGRILTHETGFKFAVDSSGVSAYSDRNARIGKYSTIKEATTAGKNFFNSVHSKFEDYRKTAEKQQDTERKNFQVLEPHERQAAIDSGDVFSLQRVKDFIGSRKLIRQTKEEFTIDRFEKDIKNNPEKLFDIFHNELREDLNNLQKQRAVHEQIRKLEEQLINGVPVDEDVFINQELFRLRQEWHDAESPIKNKFVANRFYNLLEDFGTQQEKNGRQFTPVDVLINQNKIDLTTQGVSIDEFVMTLNDTLDILKKGNTQRDGDVDFVNGIYGKAYNQNFQTGVPFVTLGTHGTKYLEMMFAREILAEKLGSRYSIESSQSGGFYSGGQHTSMQYAEYPSANAKDALARMAFPKTAKEAIEASPALMAEWNSLRYSEMPRLLEDLLTVYFNGKDADGFYTGITGNKVTESTLVKIILNDVLGFANDISSVPHAERLEILKNIIEGSVFDPEKGAPLLNVQHAGVNTFHEYVERAKKQSGEYFVHAASNGFFNNLSKRLISDASDRALYFTSEYKKGILGELGWKITNRGNEGGSSKTVSTAIAVAEGYDTVVFLRNKYGHNKDIAGKDFSIPDKSLYYSKLVDWKSDHYFNLIEELGAIGTKISVPMPANTPMQTRALFRMDNPLVIEGRKSYAEYFLKDKIRPAKAAGHDGIVFREMRDGGNYDNIYIIFKDGLKDNQLGLDTSFDDVSVPRGNDESGEKVRYGKDLGLAFQPTDEGEAPKQIQGIKLDMTKAYDVFRKEYEESTGQSWTQDKFMQRAKNWQFFGDENGFVAVRPQRSGFIKLVGMAGDNKSKLRGIQQIQELSLPVWGMVSKDIKDMAVKRGMREPNMIERTLLKQALNSAALGDAEILGYTSDNGVRLKYPDIGEVVKYMVGSQEYYAKLRSQFGEQVKQKIGFQPDEVSQGGRKYDPASKEFRTKFIGKWAEENPDRLKGYDLEFIDRGTKYGTHNVRIRLQDNSTVGMTQDVGHITADIDPKTKVASLNSNIGVKYRGNKLSYALYSEMAERLRSMGVQKVDGTIINPEGIPIKVREKIIGNTRVLRSDGSSGLPIDYKQGARIIQRRQAESGKTGTWGGLDVVNELDFNARYQPTDYQGGDDYYKKETKKSSKKIPAKYKDFPTSPEGVDEFGAKIRYAYYFNPKTGELERVDFPHTYMEIGHEINNKEVYLWSLNNADFKKHGIHEDSPITLESMERMMRDKDAPAHGYGKLALSEVRGRIEMPVYKDGKVVEKGRASIGIVAGGEGKLSTADVRLLKEKIVRKFGVDTITEKDFDFYLYTADTELRSKFGISTKDRLGINFQPDESKIGTQSSNVKLLLEGIKSGRILRTASYKGLGLEDSLLIAHTPDTAKIGQVTAGDKALADLQGGIFYAIANGKKIWASNFAGEGETNILVKFANRALKKNEGNKTYIMLVKADNSKIFASVDGARGVSSIFKHLNDSGVMSDLKYVKALKDSAKKHLNLTGLDGLGKDELFSKIDDAILNSEANKISFERRAKFSRSIATLLKDSGAFDSERSKKALAESFNSGFERGFSKKEMERVFGNLMAEDIIKDVPIGHVYGAIEIVNPLAETKESNHRGYNASIVQESGEPARLIMFDKTAHATEVLNKKSGERILKKDPTRHLKDSEGNYVHETDETGELVLTKKGKPKRVVEYKGEGSYISYTGGNIPYQEVRGKSRMPFQPAEYSEFKSEQSPTGRILRNAKGYVIMLANNKFRVYNPAKAIIGVYGNEEEAKKRIYKEIPKR